MYIRGGKTKTAKVEFYCPAYIHLDLFPDNVYESHNRLSLKLWTHVFSSGSASKSPWSFIRPLHNLRDNVGYEIYTRTKICAVLYLI